MINLLSALFNLKSFSLNLISQSVVSLILIVESKLLMINNSCLSSVSKFNDVGVIAIALT